MKLEKQNECCICGINLHKHKLASNIVLCEGGIREICFPCWNYKFAKTNRKCKLCGKRVDYPYFMKDEKHNKILVCKRCYYSKYE